LDWSAKAAWMREEGVRVATWDDDDHLLHLELDPKHRPVDEEPQQTNQQHSPSEQPDVMRAEERRIATAATGRPVKLVGADG
jgi:hypothetical protein